MTAQYSTTDTVGSAQGLGLFASFRALLSPRGNRDLTTAIVLHVLTGFLEGLALLAFLPLALALSTGAQTWGMGTGGWLVTLAVLAVAGGVLRYAEALVGYRAAVDFIETAHVAIGNAVARLPMGWFSRKRTGELSGLVSHQFMQAAEVLAHMLSTLVTGTSTLVTVAVGLWFLDVRLGMIITVLTPVTVLLLWLSRTIKKGIDARTHQAGADVSSRIVEFSSCQAALRAAGRARSFAPLDRAIADDARAQTTSLWISSAALALGSMAVQALIVASIIVAGTLALDQALGPIETIAFIGIMLRFGLVLQSLSQMVVALESGRIPLRKTHEILSTPRLPEAESPVELTAPGRIELDRVTFGYASGAPVLEAVDLAVPAGAMTAIVGPSGSGKSTITSLIARFWDVDAGTVRVGGADIREMPTQQLMSQLSMVFQDVYLFDDTLWANIAVGDPSASRERILEAAAMSGVTSIAEALPAGWDTPVGEGGRALSGGERQRVSIARALLKGAPIVLIDEASSALDAENEANVLASIDRLRTTSTLIVIAHKLDTVRRADRIVVLDGAGGIAEAGTHESLLEHGGRYRSFWDQRQAAAGWRLSG
jgi:ATP-binding cassette subfamily B protein